MSVNLIASGPGAMDHGIQRAKLPVAAEGMGTGNEVLNMDYPMREFFFSNDSESNDAMIEIVGNGFDFSYTLYAGDTIDERFSEFSKVTITATDGWRWIARSGKVN